MFAILFDSAKWIKQMIKKSFSFTFVFSMAGFTGSGTLWEHMFPWTATQKSYDLHDKAVLSSVSSKTHMTINI